MIGELSNHLWQSTLFAVGAGLLVVALRRNSARIRHAIWLSASLKFLVPFSLLMGAGSLLARPSAGPIGASPAPPAAAVVVEQIAQPFSSDVISSAPASARDVNWLPVVLGIWIAGFLTIVIVRLNGWRRVQAALRSSAPFELSSNGRIPPDVEARTSRSLFEPGIVGVWRPVLLLPAEIETVLTPAQLDAVIAHELCHVRRRDNLSASAQMVVEALFWFYPLVWWIGARLVDERERACDEYVLDTLGRPKDYAEGIVAICRRYVESPLECVSGVTGRVSRRRLRYRIEAIMINRTGSRPSVALRIAIVSALVLAGIAPIAAGVIMAPLRHLQDVTSSQPVRRFDVASIRPCEPQPVPPGGRSGGGNGSFSPGRAYLNCFYVRNLINVAYVNNRDDSHPDDPLDAWTRIAGDVGPDGRSTGQRIRGGPPWVYTDKYTIEAKADGLDPSQPPNTPGRPARTDRAVMLGPMLRALLEDRFRLKVHQETEQAPMWALTVAKGGLKVKPLGPDGDCVKLDSSKDRIPGMDEQIAMARRGEKRICGFGAMGGMVGPNNALVLNNQPMAGVARMLSMSMDRYVVDRTGVSGNFNLYLEFAPDGAATDKLFFNPRDPADNKGTPTAASLFTALQEQLGLKLEPTTGSRAYLVIDHIERPVPDIPARQPPARARGSGR